MTRENATAGGGARLGDLQVLRPITLDPLGEVLEVRPGGGGEATLLARTFSFPGMDAAALHRRAVARRGELAPHPLLAVGMGTDQRRVYLTYPRAAGRDLGALLAASRREGFPIPVDQALALVFELVESLVRASGGQSVARHGFLVPQLIHVGRGGEVIPRGLEMGAALAASLPNAALETAFGGYLSPELKAGQPSSADDVFALGAILLELVSGQSPPAADWARTLVWNAFDAGGTLEHCRNLRPVLRAALGDPGERSRDLLSWRHLLGELIEMEAIRVSPGSRAFVVEYLFGRQLEAEEAGSQPQAETARRPPEVPTAVISVGPKSPSVEKSSTFRAASSEVASAAPTAPAKPTEEAPATVVPLSSSAAAPSSGDYRVGRRPLGLWLAAASVLAVVGLWAVLSSSPKTAVVSPHGGAPSAQTPLASAERGDLVPAPQLPSAVAPKDPVAAESTASKPSAAPVAKPAPPLATTIPPPATAAQVPVAPGPSVAEKREPPPVEPARPATRVPAPAAEPLPSEPNHEPAPAGVRAESAAAASPAVASPAPSATGGQRTPPAASPAPPSAPAITAPAPQVTSLSPAALGRGSIRVVVVRGTGFDAQSSVVVNRRRSPAQGVVVERVVFVSPQELKVTINVYENASLGGCLLSVVSPDRQPSNSVILEIRL